MKINYITTMKYSLVTIIALFTLTISVYGQDIKKPNVKKITIYKSDFEEGTGKPVIDKETTFDPQGNIIVEKIYKDGAVDEHFSYKYDPMGNKTEEIEYKDNGKVKKITHYKYANNLRVERIVLDSKGKVKSKKTYEYEMY